MKKRNKFLFSLYLDFLFLFLLSGCDLSVSKKDPKVLFVGNIQYDSTSSKQEYETNRITFLLSSVSEEAVKNQADLVVFFGDIAKNSALSLSENTYFSSSLKNVNFSYLVFPGETDCLSDDEWLQLYGNKRSAAVTSGDSVIFFDDFYTVDFLGRKSSFSGPHFSSLFPEFGINKRTKLIYSCFDYYKNKNWLSDSREIARLSSLSCVVFSSSSIPEFSYSYLELYEAYRIPGFSAGSFCYPYAPSLSNQDAEWKQKYFWGFSLYSHDSNVTYFQRICPKYTFTNGDVFDEIVSEQYFAARYEVVSPIVLICVFALFGCASFFVTWRLDQEI